MVYSTSLESYNNKSEGKLVLQACRLGQPPKSSYSKLMSHFVMVPIYSLLGTQKLRNRVRAGW